MWSSAVKIKYNLTVEDIVAFNCYHTQHSPGVRRMQRIYTWGVPVVALAASAPLSWSGVWADAPIWLGIWSAAYLGIRMLTPPRYFVGKTVRRMVKEGRNKGMVGPQELALVEGGILARNASGERKVSWAGVERVVLAAAHTFVYISPVAALVIPRREVPADEYQKFVDEVTRQHRAMAPGV
jgi:hypothetical protein